MKFEELLEKVGINCPSWLCGREVSDIVTNSAEAKKDCIFVCLRGSRYDGHDHIDDAVAAGAVVIVAEKVRGVSVGGAALTLVNNTRLCASLLYNEWYGSPCGAMKIIGVTGTNGKTSVACMLKRIFEDVGYSCALIGTLGIFSKSKRLDGGGLSLSNMTTPDPKTLYSSLAEMKRDGVEYVFMEVSSHALAQCRTDAIDFDCAVFTNLSKEHLDYHGDMESYYKAKEKLFLRSRRAVVNADDTAGRRLIRILREAKVDFLTCSRSEGDFCALLEDADRPEGSFEIQYTLKTAEARTRVSLPNFSGEFQIMNSLEAAAVALSYGIPVESVRDSFAKMQGVRGRMEQVWAHEKQDIRIFIDYAHTPDALEKLLYSVRAQRERGARIVLVFGCGGERDRGKRKLMGMIASRLADLSVITSDNSRGEELADIIRDILKGIDKEKRYAVIEDRASAIKRAILEYTAAGDILVLAGKGHETYEIDKNGVHAFDERKIIREALCELFEDKPQVRGKDREK